jgi:hypothetical protein
MSVLPAPCSGSSSGGKIAQLAKEGDVPERLAALRSKDDFFRLLDEKGV